MPVTISCRTAAARPWTAYARTRGEQVLRALGLGRDELSLSLVDDHEMRALNAAYRGRDRTTDVLAFALTEDAAPDVPVTVASTGRRGRVLGDVVISIDTAAAQAHESRVPLAARLDALLVHGVLHLVGYDHERSPTEERRMRRKERAVRAVLPALTPRRRVGAEEARR
jgi:probable rRNA maturation factor